MLRSSALMGHDSISVLRQRDNSYPTVFTTYKKAGFTLIELMITIAIAAVILALAAPSFQRVISNNRVTAATNELSASLAAARSESVKRNTYTILLPGDGNWAHGYTVAVNPGNDDDLSTGDETTLQNVDAAPDSVFVTSTTTSIKFDALGAAVKRGDFIICSVGAFKKTLSVNAGGSTRLSKGAVQCECDPPKDCP